MAEPLPSSRRPWAGTAVDAWLAAVLAVLSLGYVLWMPAGAPYRPESVGALLLAVAGPLALLWRQTAPLLAQALTGTAIVVNAAAGFAIGFLEWPAWIAVFTCFDVGGRRVRTASVAMAALSIAGYVAFSPGAPSRQLPGIVVHFLVAIVVGDLSSRRARLAAAEARRAAANREQALAAERLLLHERARLARELHDSLGHTVNVMVLQAGVGRRVFADNPAYAREALASIETAGRGALDELNRLLRVLRPDEPEAVAEPFAPTVADLAELVERIRATGRPVELRTVGVELAGSSARAVYRIVQEALTNAVRHSAGPIRVEIEQVGAEVRLEVTNGCDERPDAVPGHGLVNMRERARLEGGELTAGPVDGRFRVRAVLPVTTAVAP